MSAHTCLNAEAYREAYIAAALGETARLDPAVVAEALAHAASCPCCRAELAACHRLVRLLSPPPTPDAVVARIGSNLEHRIRAWRRRRRLLRWAAALAAGAAVALAAIALLPLTRAGRSPARAVTQAPAGTVLTPGTGPDGMPQRIGGEGRLTAREPLAKLEEARRLREAGTRLVRQRRHAEAEAPLRKAVALLDGLRAAAPDSDAAFAAFYEQYRCYEVLGDWVAREDAFLHYLSAVRQDCGDEVAGRTLVEDARRLVRSGDLDTVGRRLDRALACCPDGPVAMAARVLMGAAAEQAQLLDLAYTQYHALLALGAPPDVQAAALWHMALINDRLSRSGAALADARALCSLSHPALPVEERVGRSCLLAHMYARRGDALAASRVLREVIQGTDPRYTHLARAILQKVEAAVAKDIEQGAAK